MTSLFTLTRAPVRLSRLTVNTSVLRKSNETIFEAFSKALNEGRMV